MDRWIAPSLLAEPWTRTRARMCMGFAYLAVASFLILLAIGAFAMHKVVVAGVVGIAAAMVLPVMLRRGVSVRLAAGFLLTTTYAAVLINAMEFGGLVWVLSWSAVLTIGTMFLLGRKAAGAFVLISVACTIALSLGHLFGAFPHFSEIVVNERETAIRLMVMVIMQAVVAFFFGRLYADEHRRLADDLDAARKLADQANAAKSVFLATMSHEIRTPMNGVLAASDLLRRGPLSAEEKRLAELVFSSGEALLSLLNDILDLSKLEAGKVELETRPFNVGELCRSVIHLLEARAAQKSLELSLVLDPSLPARCQGDSGRLRQVLLNLVVNAIKFTPAGSVRLRVGPSAGGLLFAVEDTGIGMSSEQMARLFQPFVQGSAATNGIYGGTGLGLAISQRLVRAMGGIIEIESALGRGSSFFFTLPLPIADTAHTSLAPTPIARAGGNGTVLIVDDNDVNRIVAEAMVRRLGRPTVLAKNGQEALEILSQSPVSIVLMDWQMPVLDGLSATRRLRALPGPEHSTPVLALTASAMQEEVTACLEAGMNDVLLKPLTLDALEEALLRWDAKLSPKALEPQVQRSS
ncbi:MAG: ATP-binding protein [Myxococcota bacterium]